MKSRKFLFYNFGFFNPAIDIYGLILRYIVNFFFTQVFTKSQIFVYLYIYVSIIIY